MYVSKSPTFHVQNIYTGIGELNSCGLMVAGKEDLSVKIFPLH